MTEAILLRLEYGGHHCKSAWQSVGEATSVYLQQQEASDSHSGKAEPVRFHDRPENFISMSVHKRQALRDVTKQEIKSANSVASGVVSLWRAVIITTCYSQITHSSDLKEQVIGYLNVFTGILAGTAFSYSHAPTYTELSRLQGA